jgi:hypothetical protein
MKKLFIGFIGTALVLGTICFIIYRLYFPDIVADAIISQEEVPVYIPRRIKAKIEYYKAPANQGAEVIIKKMHESNITLDQLFEAIDNTTDDQLMAMLQELSTTTITSADQVFTIMKKYIEADFDMETFRKPFTEKVNLKMIKKGLYFAKAYNNEIDSKTAKSIVKKILLQKEQEYNKLVHP